MRHPLLRPFSYLCIKHETSLPVWVNWVIPAVFSLACTAILYKLVPASELFDDNGFFSRVLGFIQSLAGFYMAALAAIATFNSVDMDRHMPGNTPTMNIVYNGGLEEIKLTRRRFLSSMFAYLTLISLIVTLLSIGVLAIGPAVQNLIPTQWSWLAKLSFLFGYTLAIFQMISVTIWGLFYLGERIHTPDT